MEYYFINQNDQYQTLVEVSPYSGSLADLGLKLNHGNNNQKSLLDFNDDDSNLPRGSDIYTAFSPVLIFTDKAIKYLSDLNGMERNIEIAVDFPEQNLKAIIVNNLVLGGLDKKHSNYDEYDNGFVIFSHVLKRACVADHDIFRIEESPSCVFVSEIFKARVEASGLKGFLFRKVLTI
ncbi:imm11 family protein [Pseudomonas luteola]|uniref:imm11 family protein n=1 Tax=Pseudomonas luteola TaxID=47886 RepID=UPI0012390FF3|nr:MULTISPECIES: DUF1629 domain-containing protein [Pseudomonas]MBA1246438.1 hypothetical protein [Pseudomonas zeshuii]QEU27129.1 hypothetical protein FOB45_04835 [Pseudomonas luteola]